MQISHLYIDEPVKTMPVVKAIEERLGIEGIVVDSPDPVFQKISSARDPVTEGKHILFLTQNKGAFIKDCPGTRHYTCCGYKILHIGTFCTMDCAYCILQTYFHPPMLQLFVNWDDLFDQLNAYVKQKGILRIGTGEFTDSLIWDRWTDLSARLVSWFANQTSAVLELKTKTTAVSRIKDLPHNGKTILAWSVNTPEIIRQAERSTASLDARLSAAKTCVDLGFPVAFHFDPMVIYDGCETAYMDVVRRIVSAVDPERIAWISLGTFRFPPALKPIVQQRFPDSDIVYGEFITGLDNKMRYFKPLRIRLYRKMVSCLKQVAPQTLVYFCMEDEEVWEECFGFHPDKLGGLSKMLDTRASECCQLIG